MTVERRRAQAGARGGRQRGNTSAAVVDASKCGRIVEVVDAEPHQQDVGGVPDDVGEQRRLGARCGSPEVQDPTARGLQVGEMLAEQRRTVASFTPYPNVTESPSTARSVPGGFGAREGPANPSALMT
jgi:hypothetical protein